MSQDPSPPLLAATADPRVLYALLAAVAVIISAGQVLSKVASVPLLSHFVLGERFGPANLAGVAFLAVGIVLCQL